VRRLSLFVASVQASMDVNELGDLSRARKSQSTHLLAVIYLARAKSQKRRVLPPT
jgi:hypothetical protein